MKIDVGASFYQELQTIQNQGAFEGGKLEDAIRKFGDQDGPQFEIWVSKLATELEDNTDKNVTFVNRPVVRGRAHGELTISREDVDKLVAGVNTRLEATVKPEQEEGSVDTADYSDDEYSDDTVVGD